MLATSTVFSEIFTTVKEQPAIVYKQRHVVGDIRLSLPALS